MDSEHTVNEKKVKLLTTILRGEVREEPALLEEHNQLAHPHKHPLLPF